MKALALHKHGKKTTPLMVVLLCQDVSADVSGCEAVQGVWQDVGSIQWVCSCAKMGNSGCTAVAGCG